MRGTVEYRFQIFKESTKNVSPASLNFQFALQNFTQMALKIACLCIVDSFSVVISHGIMYPLISMGLHDCLKLVFSSKSLNSYKFRFV